MKIWEINIQYIYIYTHTHSIKKCNLNLCYARRNLFISSMQRCQRVLCARAHLRWSRSPCFSLFFGKNGHRVLSPKDERDHPDFHQRQVQKQTSVMVWRRISANGRGDLHVCEGITDVEAYIGIVQRHTLPSRWHLSWEARQYQALFSTCFIRVVSNVPDSPDLSLIENVWPIMKRRIRQRRPWTVVQLSRIRRDRAKIPLAEVSILSSKRKLKGKVKWQW